MLLLFKCKQTILTVSNPMDISKGRIQGGQQLQNFKEVTDRLKVGLTALWDLSHRLWTWTLILSPCHQGHCHVVQIHTNIWCVRAAVHYLLLLCCVSATAAPVWVIVSNGLTGRVHWLTPRWLPEWMTTRQAVFIGIGIVEGCQPPHPPFFVSFAMSSSLSLSSQQSPQSPLSPRRLP